MKAYWLIFSVLALCTSCTTEDGILEENKKIVRSYIDAVQSNDFETMEALLSDDYKAFGPSVGDSTDKVNALASWKELTETLYESVEYTRTQFISTHVTNGDAPKGYWVSVWADLSVYYKEIDTPVHLYTNTAYMLKDGKIVHSRTFYNEADALRQLGFEFTYPEY